MFICLSGLLAGRKVGARPAWSDEENRNATSRLCAFTFGCCHSEIPRAPYLTTDFPLQVSIASASWPGVAEAREETQCNSLCLCATISTIPSALFGRHNQGGKGRGSSMLLLMKFIPITVLIDHTSNTAAETFCGQATLSVPKHACFDAKPTRSLPMLFSNFGPSQFSLPVVRARHGCGVLSLGLLIAIPHTCISYIDT